MKVMIKGILKDDADMTKLGLKPVRQSLDALKLIE